LQNEEAQTHSNGLVIFMVVALFIIMPPLLVFSIRRMRLREDTEDVGGGRVAYSAGGQGNPVTF